jgi:hypothetical protein
MKLLGFDSSLTKYFLFLKTRGKYIKATNTTNNTPHSIANPRPGSINISLHKVCPIMQEPILAPIIALGTAIMQKK